MPGFTSENRNRPSPLVCPARVAFVSTLVAITSALASAAPVGSATVPEMALDVPLCPTDNCELTMVKSRKQIKKYLIVRVHVMRNLRGEIGELASHCCLNQQPGIEPGNERGREPRQPLQPAPVHKLAHLFPAPGKHHQRNHRKAQLQRQNYLVENQ